MTSFLEKILGQKREEIGLRRKMIPVDRLKGLPAFSRPVKSLRGALAGKRPAIIAEIKKASPSRGVLRDQFDHRAIARQYVEGGAHALSVLTDNKFFQGDLTFLDDLAPVVPVPILRKDFIIDPYQLYESKAHGADAILLIAAAVDPIQLHDLHAEAGSLGLECLVEVHTREEIASLDGMAAGIVGINNRDLSTFEVNLATSSRLASLLPGSAIIVSESGISTPGDVQTLAAINIHAVLIGELFMKSADPGAALRDFLAKAGTT
ncbi:MAG TPA: indole-3-glycerol phosphate synthase TrpC [Bacteroidota bacterium]|nr:indole-3-glycerol phosphate synthase TrpC [Bacteroidota bacterium]